VSYFGETDATDLDAMSQHAHRGLTSQVTTKHGYSVSSTPPSPLSYLRPMTPYGDTYTPSYTRYLGTAGSSYVNPLFPLFNDRRPQAPKIRTTLNTPGRVPGMGEEL